MFNVIVTLSTGYIIGIICGAVYGCVRCIKVLKFKHRQIRNERGVNRNAQHFQLRLLPDSVQNFSSYN